MKKSHQQIIQGENAAAKSSIDLMANGDGSSLNPNPHGGGGVFHPLSKFSRCVFQKLYLRELIVSVFDMQNV